MRKIHLNQADSFTSSGTKIEAGKFDALKHSPSPISADPQHLNTTKRLILVIDDSATVRKIVATCLQRQSFEVEGFPDGIEAMNWFMQPNARIPELIFLDILLPKLDGYEVARRLKAKTQFERTVIIMLSRRDGVIDRLKGRLAGAKGSISKPFTTQVIISTVETYLGTPV